MRYYRPQSYRDIRFSDDEAEKIIREIKTVKDTLFKAWRYVNNDLNKRVINLMSDNKNDFDLGHAYDNYLYVRKKLPEITQALDNAGTFIESFSRKH